MTTKCDHQYLRDKKSSASNLKDAIDECTCVSKSSRIVLKENKGKCEIENNTNIKVQIACLDPCVTMLEQERKCDFIVTWNDKKNIIVYYVELKGKNHKDAFEQLLATINHCKSIHCSCTRRCHIAACPPVASSTIQKYQKEFSKQKIELSANVALQAS